MHRSLVLQHCLNELAGIVTLGSYMYEVSIQIKSSYYEILNFRTFKLKWSNHNKRGDKNIKK